MSERYYQHQFPNGLILLGEKMPGMQSAAMSLLLPAGASTDPVERLGTATVLSDLVLRGAGSRDSRKLTDHLDNLGLQRSNTVGVYHARFSWTGLADRVVEAIPVYADIVRRPHLPENGFEAARDLALQSLAGIDDDPRQKLLIKLREWHLPSPLGRSSMGKQDDLEKLTLDQCRMDHSRRYQPAGAILSIAGNIDFTRILGEVETHFADWEPQPARDIELTPPPGRFHHEIQQSEQTHIGLAYGSIPETHEDYYAIRMALEVLSGGMSGRLFTEVREKRGLCYSVWAGYSSLKNTGFVQGYAGTSNDRAQATLDCLLDELHRLSDGVTQQELDRAKTGLKASTIMQGESTNARAGAIAHDYFMRGRIRRLDEIKQAINGVTLERVNACLAGNKPGEFTFVTVGPRPLTLPG